MNFKHHLKDHFNSYKKSGYIKDNYKANEYPKPIVDCSFGVNPFGYSKKLDIKSMVERKDINNYASFPFYDLMDGIIKFWKSEQELSYQNIHVCAGSMIIIDSINTLFINEGDKVLGYGPQFPGYVDSIKLHGGKYDMFPLNIQNNFKFIGGKFIEWMKKDEYKFVFIDNPNNPTGQIISISDIEEIVFQASKQDIIVIVDEAYGDYMSKRNSAITLFDRYNNLFVLRSFSKGYGLAGLRLGYVVSSSELSNYYSIIDNFLVNSIGLSAAKISLTDSEFLEKTISKTKLIKEKLLNSLSKFKVLETNNQVPIFTMMHPSQEVNLEDLLLRKGIVSSSGFDNLGENYVRVRIPKDINPLLRLLNELENSIV